MTFRAWFALSLLPLCACTVDSELGELAESLNSLSCPIAALTPDIVDGVPGKAGVMETEGGLVAWQPISDGWLQLVFPTGVATSGSAPGVDSGECLRYVAYFPAETQTLCGIDDAGACAPASYPVQAQVTVVAGGQERGQAFEVQLTGVSYAFGDAGVAGLPDVSMSFEVE